MGLTERSFLERMELMGFTPSRAVTNADRIRAMTDEELAEFLQDVAMQGGIELGGRLTTWLDWLKQEVKDGNT